MNKLYFILLNIILCVTLISCSDDIAPTPYLTQYEIQVSYPENYTTSQANQVQVELKNLHTNKRVTALTNQEGVALFSDLLPGMYSATASKNLNEDESELLTGLRSQVFLNGSISQIKIANHNTDKIKLNGSIAGNWVIKEFYYSGAPNSYYFYDGFIEIYNNSTDTLYADGLLIGSTKSASSSLKSFYGFITEGYKDVYVSTILRIPGTGKEHPVDPGKSVVIAIDGINHKNDPNGNPNSPVNLGPDIADWEVYYYVNPNTPDTDSPNVPNMEIVYAATTTTFDYLPGVMGSGLIIFQHDDPEKFEIFSEPNSTGKTMYAKVPEHCIIDALDAVANNTITPNLKRIPIGLDAGMNTVGRVYNGTSLRRKVKQEINGRRILLDTNNSSVDFEANPNPTPKNW